MGIAWAFGVNSLSYVAVLVGLFMIRLPAWQPRAQLVRPLDGIRETIAYMRGTPLVAALMKLVTVYSILGVPYLTLMPVFARNRLGLDASGYGLLLASVGIGGLVGALMLAARAGPQPGLRTLTLSTLTYPIILIILSAVTKARPAYFLLFLAGIAMIANGAQSNAMLQHSVPDSMRGRLMAAYSFVVVGWTDNCALAKLREGLVLVRIGKALRPEMAAWRYGDQFGRRRRKHILVTGAAVAAVGGIVVLGPMTGIIGVGGWGTWQIVSN